MKKTLLFMLAVVATFFGHNGVMAQNTPVPEFAYKVNYVKNNTLVQLDRTKLSIKQKGRFGGGSVFYLAEGSSSSMTLSGKTSDKFIVKLIAGMDPEGQVVLLKFEDQDKKGNRLYEYANVSMGSQKKEPDNSIKLDRTKVADGVYEYSPQTDLPPGEYFFMVMSGGMEAPTAQEMANQQTLTSYCFNVK